VSTHRTIIYAVVNKKASDNIYRIRPNGTDKEQVTANRDEFTHPDAHPWGHGISVKHTVGTDRDIWFHHKLNIEPPVLEPIGYDTVEAETELEIVLAASDPNNDPLTYAAFWLPSGASLSNNVFTWTPECEQAGNHPISFRVLDGTGGVDHEYVVISVEQCSGGGCPELATLTNLGWHRENTLLARSTSGTPVADAYRLKQAPRNLDGSLRLSIAENGSDYSTIDEASIVAIDRPEASHVYRIGDRFVLGEWAPATRVWSASGGDLTDDATSAQSYVVGLPGDTLYVELPAPRQTSGSRRDLAPQQGGGGGGGGGEGGGKEIDPKVDGGLRTTASLDQRILSETGILIQVPAGPNGWRTVQKYYPRADFDEFAIDSVPTGLMRLVFIGRHQVRRLGRITYLASLAEPTPRAPLEATHSRVGSVRSKLSATDGETITIEPGDALALSFDAGEPAAGMVREWFLLTHGSYSSASPAGDGAAARVPEPQFVLALGAARPNPATSSVRIPFSLPQSQLVSLRLYDVSGRLVRTLVSERREAGEYEVTWDGRTDGGVPVRGGVYFYRMQADDWVSQRKVVYISH
jgi:hypothetical protein